ncbi:MAG: shikimate kinase [Bacilli bacterium]
MIALIGFTGAGKSSLGRELSAAYGLRLLDTDELVERRLGMSVRDVFVLRGENYFREVEEREILAACAEGVASSVLVTGGGAVKSPRVREALCEHCFIVHVTAPLDVIEERLESDATRPLLAGDDLRASLKALYRTREPLYAIAHAAVECEDLSAAASQLMAKWEEWRRGKERAVAHPDPQ